MAQETNKPDIEKLLPPNDARGPFSGHLSDIMMLPESLRRTGRAAGLSEAAGEKTPANLKYPMTSSTGATLLGGVTGGALGGATGVLAEALKRRGKITGIPGASGALLGSLGGSVYGALSSIYKRRKLIEAVKEKVKDKELNTGDVELGNILASPWSGMHQLGKSDVITGNTNNKALQHIATGTRLIPVNTGGLAGLVNGGANIGAYLEARNAHKTAGFRGPMDIIPPKSLGDKGIQSVLKNLSKRKKINKPPFPGPDEVLDRAAGYLADKGFLKKKSEEKQARCWSGFEPVPGKKAYSEGSCRPKTQTTKRVNEKVAYLLYKIAYLNDKTVQKGSAAAGGLKGMGGGGGDQFTGGISGASGTGRVGSAVKSLGSGIAKGVSALGGAAMPGAGMARGIGNAAGRGVRSAAGAVGRGIGAAAGAVGRGAMGAFNASPMGMGMRAGQSIGRGIGAAARGIGGAASAAGSAIGKGVSTAYNNSPMGMGARAGKAIGRGIAGAAKGFASGVMGKSGEEIPLEELTAALDKLASLKKKSQVTKSAAGTTTVYYASPERQLVRIPKDTVVSLSQDLAYQMGRFYPETKETWSDKDVSGKWNGGTPQPTFRAGRMPTGRPTLYKAQVNESDLAVISSMVKSVKKLRRSVAAVAVKQNKEK